MQKSQWNLLLAAALLFANPPPSSGQNPTPLLTRPVEQLIAVLKSDAAQKEKADACRELSVVGTKDAVPALAALLPDEAMHHMARYALETIKDPSADKVLRDALGNLKGRLLAGVVGSLGVRRDPVAIEPLGRLLQDGDDEVAQAAARALGKIGTAAAAKTLSSALAGISAAHQLAVCEGLFRCAETLTRVGQREEALAIFDRLRGLQNAPHQVRAGAWRGAILDRGNEGLPLLLQALRGNDFVLVGAAARTALELPGAEVTSALAKELEMLHSSVALAPELARSKTDRQILIIQTLGRRGDVAALPALTSSAKTGEPTVRLAAIRALPEIGHASSALFLMDLLSDPQREVAQAAQESLAGLPGPEVDAAVMSMLSQGPTDQRLAALELIARRRMTAAVPVLLKTAGDADVKVRPAALSKLGELAGPGDLPALMNLLVDAKAAQDLNAAEQAVTAVCARAQNPESCITMITGRLAQASPVTKGSLLRLLSNIGGTSALKAVRAALDDSDGEVRKTAIRALGDWRTADAAPDLLGLAQSASNPADKTLGLRGYLNLAAQADLSAEQRLSMCRQAASLVQRSEEKKLLLAALGNINSTDALELIAPHLENAATKEEASAAVLAVAEKQLQGGNASKAAPKLIEPLGKAAQATANADQAKRANALLQQAKSKATAK